MFKVGDKVKCIKNWDSKIKVGEIRTVFMHRYGECIGYVDGDQEGCLLNVCPHHFELVLGTNELEELVKKANEGQIAKSKLDKYLDQYESFDPDSDKAFKTPTKHGSAIKYRIKSKTRKFKVANWDAEINDNEITIGCNKFYKPTLINALLNLIRDNYSSSSELKATKIGIKYHDNFLSWEEAQNLLRELEK